MQEQTKENYKKNVFSFSKWNVLKHIIFSFGNLLGKEIEDTHLADAHLASRN